MIWGKRVRSWSYNLSSSPPKLKWPIYLSTNLFLSTQLMTKHFVFAFYSPMDYWSFLQLTPLLWFLTLHLKKASIEDKRAKSYSWFNNNISQYKLTLTSEIKAIYSAFSKNSLLFIRKLEKRKKRKVFLSSCSL